MSLRAGTDGVVTVNSRDKDGNAAAHLTARIGNRRLLHHLLEHGADMNIAAADTGRTPLHVAVIEGKSDVVQLLITWGAGLDQQDKTGNTALHHAAIGNMEEVAGILLRAGADVGLRNFAGKTALDESRERGNMAVKKLLQE